MTEKKLKLLVFIIIFFSLFNCYSQEINYQNKWSVNDLFEPKLFIENKGQFNSSKNKASEILYATEISGVKIYFTKKGITYNFQKSKTGAYEAMKREEKEREKKNKEHMFNSLVIKKGVIEGDKEELADLIESENAILTWLNVDTSKIDVLTAKKSLQYFTYADNSNKAGNPATIKADGYEKIFYKSMYPNIDVEFYFHVGGGIKYNIFLHPGADPKQIKFLWESKNGIVLKEDGSLAVRTSYGDIIDHPPVSFYSDSKIKITTNYILHDKNTIGFNLSNYDNSKEVVIDPWLTNPLLTGPNRALDISKDALGNSYVYGGPTWPFSLKVTKINSTGAIVWTFNSMTVVWIGDIATDFAGNSYVSDGNASGHIVKLSPLGTIIFNNNNAASGITPSVFECFRLVFNNNQTQFISGSFPGTPQIVNINPLTGALFGLSPNFPLNTSEVRGLTFSPNGNIYGLTTASTPGETIDVFSATPAFSLLWGVNSGYTFGNFNYFAPAYSTYTMTNSNPVNPTPGGQNCIAASNCYVYTYEGQTITQRNIQNGTLVASIAVPGGIAGQNSGIIVDDCENIYVGTSTGVSKFDYNLNLITSANLGGAVYDLCFNNNEVVAGGNGFVTSISNLLILPCPTPSAVVSQTNPTACNSCDGVASVSVTNLIPPITYSWSNGSTTTSTLTNNSISNLCPGAYQVTVTNCSGSFTYSANYLLIGASSNATVNSTIIQPSCTSPTGSIIINSITNGVPNYTLAEATTTLASNFATPYSLTNVAVGSHTYVVTDANGCTTTFTANILPGGALPNLSVASPVILNCNPTTQTLSAASTATGSPTYAWTGSGILSGANTPSPVINAAGNYTVTLTQGLCTNSAVVVVSSNTNIPNISIANINTLTCLNNSFVITGTSTTSGVSYSWTPLSVTTASALITAAGNYTLDVTHIGSGCKTSSVITVNQNTVSPNITILPTGTLSCLNTSITLTGNSTTSGASFSWSPQGVTTASALATAASNYTFTVTDPLNGCISNSIVAVTQNTTSPNLNVNPSTTLTCLNPTATLSATSAGNTIVWNGGSLTNATNPVTVNLAGTYSATATDPISGCSTTSIITVSQNTTNPNININPATALTCLNPSTTLTAISSGNTILWNGGSLNNATNPATVNIAGTYSATATDPINGCTTTQTLTLNQNTTSPNVNAGLSQSITCSIPTVTLNGSSSTTGATFSWSPIGINTATAQVNAAGNYTLTVTDPTNGCINSATTTVIASGAFPNISISPTGTLSCLNTSLTLTGSSTTSAASFSWAPQGVNTPSALATTAGNYTFMVTDPLNGCTSSSVITITQNTTSPILNINPSTTLTCLNPIATLSATSAGNTIVWNGGSLTNATNPATINLAGTYSATATNPVNGCVDTQIITVNQNTTVPTLNITASATNLNCNTSSVTLTGSSNVNAGVYLWSTNVLGANNLPTATANNAGTYSLTVTDPLNGCFNTATVGVSSAPMFSASVVVLSQINCFGNNNGALQIGVVSGGTAPFSITNLNSGSSINNIASFPIVLSNLSAANYSILVSDANGCNQTLFATITQPAALNLALGGNSTLCEGQSTTISSNVSGGSAPYAYVWSPTGGNGANLNTGTTISTNTTFSLLLTDNNGCQAQASIAIVVNPKPNATLINNKLTGCSPVCAGFSLSAQQQPGYVYTWQFTNNQSGSVTSSQLYQPDLCFKEEGSYNAGVVISSSAGCSTTVTYNNLIQVYEKPMADFSFSPTSVTMLEPLVSFTNSSSGASVYGWYNSNINSLFSNQANPTYVFQEPGNYLIALVATNGSCSDTALKLIEVEEEFLFYAPNAFTPNEDNLNDTWYPLVTGYKEGSFNLLLFDRWGEQLYQSNDPTSKGWDGFYKKQLCKDDVYIWKVSVKDRKGKLHQFMGHVSLNK